MRGKQLGISHCELTAVSQRIKLDKFLLEIDVVVPWHGPIDFVVPHYPQTSQKGGGPPWWLVTFLRIHL